MIILRGVNVFPSQIEEQVLAQPGLAPHFQIELRREGRMDSMAISVEAASSAEDRLQLAARLQKRIKQILGLTVQVNAGAPGSVPRFDGKAVRIVDNRPKA
jgi:phenylacetate-CoA ligase